MPVKRKSSRNAPKISRNVKITQKRSKRASQKKRGRKMSRRQHGGEDEALIAQLKKKRDDLINQNKSMLKEKLKYGLISQDAYDSAPTIVSVENFLEFMNILKVQGGKRMKANSIEFRPLWSKVQEQQAYCMQLVWTINKFIEKNEIKVKYRQIGYEWATRIRSNKMEVDAVKYLCEKHKEYRDHNDKNKTETKNNHEDFIDFLKTSSLIFFFTERT